MTWVDAAAAALPDESLVTVEAGDLSIVLAKAGGRWHALDAWCTHEECPLGDGWLEGEAIRCACHGALFSLADGAPLEGPATDPIRLFPVRLTTDGRIEAETPILPS